MIIPNIWINKNCSKPPTSMWLYIKRIVANLFCISGRQTFAGASATATKTCVVKVKRILSCSPFSLACEFSPSLFGLNNTFNLKAVWNYLNGMKRRNPKLTITMKFAKIQTISDSWWLLMLIIESARITSWQSIRARPLWAHLEASSGSGVMASLPKSSERARSQSVISPPAKPWFRLLYSLVMTITIT